MASSLPAFGHRTYKSPVATFADLPATGNTTNDVKVVDDTGIVYRWDGSQWIPIKADATPGSVASGSGTTIENVTCDASVYIGAAVIMNGGIAYNALADSTLTSNVIGIVESKSSATLCVVRVTGVTDAIFVGLTEINEYFLSAVTPGQITTTVPVTSGHVVVKLGQPYTTTQFLVSKEVRTVRA